MSLLSILFVLVAVGVIVFLIRRAPFLDADWKGYISYGILVVVVLWLLSLFLGTSGLGHIHVGR
jgi:hypothetical protein